MRHVRDNDWCQCWGNELRRTNIKEGASHDAIDRCNIALVNRIRLQMGCLYNDGTAVATGRGIERSPGHRTTAIARTKKLWKRICLQS